MSVKKQIVFDPRHGKRLITINPNKQTNDKAYIKPRGVRTKRYATHGNGAASILAL